MMMAMTAMPATTTLMMMVSSVGLPYGGADDGDTDNDDHDGADDNGDDGCY